jgi:hypothetical protein
MKIFGYSLCVETEHTTHYYLYTCLKEKISKCYLYEYFWYFCYWQRRHTFGTCLFNNISFTGCYKYRITRNSAWLKIIWQMLTCWRGCLLPGVLGLMLIAWFPGDKAPPSERPGTSKLCYPAGATVAGLSCGRQLWPDRGRSTTW